MDQEPTSFYVPRAQKGAYSPMSTVKTINSLECHLLLQYLQDPAHYQDHCLIALRNYAMALFMLDAGLRVGELVQLRYQHLYFNNVPVHTLLVPSDIAKTHIERSIPLTKRILELLATLPCKFASAWFGDHTSFVFFRGTGKFHVTTRQVHRIIRAASGACLTRSISPHTLRHTFATRLQKRTSTRVVMELLGHKSLQSTQIYTHPDTEDLTSAIRAFEEQ